MNPPDTNRGMALILALMIAGLAAAVAVTLVSSDSRWLTTWQERRDYAQARAITNAGINLTAHVLYEDVRQSNIDHLRESWAFPLPPTPIEYGSVEGSIVDLNSRLNLNNLMPTSPLRLAERNRLIALAKLLNIDPAQLQPLFNRFLDPSERQLVNPSAQPLKTTQVQPLFDSAELAPLLPAPVMKKLLPYVVALPEPTPLNVNTASRETLQSALPGLSEDELTELLSHRPFRSLAELRRALPGTNKKFDENGLAVSSKFFLSTVRSQQNNAKSETQALLRRGDKQYPETVWKIVE